ncbi:MAG: superoxide dismutase [Coxiellaceae bacterium]|nr:superoxide dismutase [Coxiellaceae bacterium]|tara:strand:- start:1313 stop:1975 length:663 start_codon:yes stop_codon:yes gene_type:complete
MKRLFAVLIGLSVCSIVSAASLSVNLYKTVPAGQQGASIGTIVAVDTEFGLLIIPHLHSLTPGIHGFHLHTNPSCADQGKAAGGHWDPGKTGMHLGPYDSEGELGDLPALTADAKGQVTLPVLAPRLKVAMLQGHALVVHEGGDNYSDLPLPLGGGGARFACGVVASNALVTQNSAIQDVDTHGDSSGKGADDGNSSDQHSDADSSAEEGGSDSSADSTS